MTLPEASFLSARISRRRALRLGLQDVTRCANPAMPAICSPDPGPAGQSAVEAAIKTAQSQGDIASISYALISCGKVFAANAHGMVSPKATASTSTLYQAASISKTLAAVAGLSAVQTNAKGCTLDSDVTAFQTSWKLPSETPGVTLRRLLGMTAGANVHGYPGYAQTCTNSANCQVPALIEILDGYPGSPAVKIDATPGAGWVYSGGGYEIAESLIGDLMGTDYGDFVQAKALAPLNMTSSAWGVPMRFRETVSATRKSAQTGLGSGAHDPEGGSRKMAPAPVAKLKDGGKAPSYRPTTFRPRASHKAPGKGM